jgi:hypothetical protein
MLQQAIALALFPEHDVQVRQEIPAESDAEAFDVVMIDLSSNPEQAELVARWNVPLIFIGPKESADGWKRNDVIFVVDKPLVKQSLESAVAKCLAGKTNGSQPKQQSTEKHSSESAAQSPVIDLTEIVEDDTAAKSSADPGALKK